MEEREMIQLLLDQQLENNKVIKEYQNSIRVVIISCITALSIMFIVNSISTAYQVHKISEEARNIVEIYFETDYDYGTIEQHVEIGE